MTSKLLQNNEPVIRLLVLAFPLIAAFLAFSVCIVLAGKRSREGGKLCSFILLPCRR